MSRLMNAVRLLGNGFQAAGCVRSELAGRGVIRENRFHIEEAVRWLMRAQDAGGEGFSRRYCLYNGWDRPYVETTGYIIPTLIGAGKYLGDERVIERAKRAADWLLRMQRDDGAFRDIDTGEAQVFDTGQVLTGLIAAFREWGDGRFLDAAVRAGSWLADVQEPDGSWERYSFNRMKHSYYVKVAAALLRLAAAAGDDTHRRTALKNIRWTLACQEPDGYFRLMEFREGEPAFLHTIMYLIEGLLDSYDILKEKEILDAAMRTVTALREINKRNTLLLCSQYGAKWVAVNREKCITGLAQWARIAMRAYALTADEDLFTQAVKTTYYLKSKQYLRSDADLHGGLPGSVPLWGRYLGFCFPNWGVKFFIDALLSHENYGVPLWREQEVWVSESFRFSASVVSDSLDAHDRKYTELIEKEIAADGTLTLLDIGCGKGKFLRYFRERFPHWTISGIDPFFYDGKDIKKGSAHALPFPDNWADIVLLIEVMQHIHDVERTMAEVARVIKAGGVLVIGDRDAASIIGILKPCLELAGFWMYAWDSPFRETWRSVKEWKSILGRDWRITSARSFDSPDNRIPMSNRFYLLTARRRES